MITATHLSAVLIETTFQEPSVHLPQLGEEFAPGMTRSLRVSSAGIVLLAGGAQMAIPMSDIWQLAESVDSRFGKPSTS
jgi:hypothetical protein